jgi:hypothetical protein
MARKNGHFLFSCNTMYINIVGKEHSTQGLQMVRALDEVEERRFHR